MQDLLPKHAGHGIQKDIRSLLAELERRIAVLSGPFSAECVVPNKHYRYHLGGGTDWERTLHFFPNCPEATVVARTAEPALLALVAASTHLFVMGFAPCDDLLAEFMPALVRVYGTVLCSEICAHGLRNKSSTVWDTMPDFDFDWVADKFIDAGPDEVAWPDWTPRP